MNETVREFVELVLRRRWYMGVERGYVKRWCRACMENQTMGEPERHLPDCVILKIGKILYGPASTTGS